MSVQLAFALAGGGLGLVAALLLCVGNLQEARQLVLGTKPFWDYNLEAMRSVASQRCHALVGSLMMVAAFFLLICAALAPATAADGLPRALQPWPNFLLAVLVVSALAAAVLARLLTGMTMKKAMRLYKGAA